MSLIFKIRSIMMTRKVLDILHPKLSVTHPFWGMIPSTKSRNNFQVLFVIINYVEFGVLEI